MPDLPKALKKRTAQFLSTLVGHNGGVPILKGPLKHSILPKTSACENLGMLLGRYEPAVVSELLSAGPISVAYDVGTHWGFMSLALSKLVGKTGKVFAFEPIPQNQLAINKLIDINRLHQVIQVTPLALGESNGKKRMLLRESSSMHQLEEVYQGNGSNIYSMVDVESCTLDSFIFERSNPFPQLIKIDVEGAEGPVLKGALKTLDIYQPTLVAEIHGPKCGHELWNLLRNFNYSWWHLTPRGRKPTPTKENLLSYFSKDSWTHHFLLSKREQLSKT